MQGKHILYVFLFAYLLGSLPLSQQIPLVTLGFGQQEYPLLDSISTDPDDVIFYLYPCLRPDSDFNEFDILVHNDLDSIEFSRYKPDLPIVVLIHGFTQDLLTDFPQDLVKAYVKSGGAARHNIVAVDWGQLSGPRIETVNNDDYMKVVNEAIPVVSQRVSEFLQFLINNNKLGGPEDIHIIGQSLGAHVSGGAGAHFHQTTGTMIRRITGTDPAGPAFQDQSPDRRLDPTDAAFVDIVHADQGGYGYKGPLGHADFYVNGGVRVQPGCEKETSSFCSHNRAPKYYAMSIIDPTITACSDEALVSNCPAELQIPFGEHCPEYARGNYYLSLHID